jgi:hypothetical protein
MKLLSNKIVYLPLLIVLALFAASFSNAAPGDTIEPFIHPGRATQPVAELQVVNNPANPASLDSGTGLYVDNLSHFPKPGSIFSVLGNLWAQGTTWIGDRDTGFEFEGFGGTVQYPTQELNIQGTFHVSNLEHAGSSSTKLCVNEIGRLQVCEAAAPTYSWVIGSWGSCSGATSGSCSGSYSGGGSCSGTPSDGGTLYRARCSDDGNYPDQDYICGFDQGEWVNTGTSCPTVTHLSLPNPPGYNDVFPYNLPQTVCLQGSAGSCDARNQSACEAVSGCTWGGTFVLCDGASQLSCESENPACTWNPGTSGTQTRTVECQDNLGNVVADSFCSGSEPADSQSC